MSDRRSYEYPRHSKGRVDRAGVRIGSKQEELSDLVVLENWRAAHANILNTFKTILYNRIREFEGAQIAQRLKRRPTILDKITREPDMRLSRMHDIAGCRVIFKSLDDLYQFRSKIHAGRFEHKRRGAEDDRWNYIDKPKSSGYRGVHDVYTYHVEPKKGRAAENQPWNGMLVEIQYRTTIQHAWATAVELAGLVTENDPKFDRGSDDFREFFRVTSEMLARVFEDATSCYPGWSDSSLISRFFEVEETSHILRLFSEMKASGSIVSPRNASILIFRYDNDLFFKDKLEIISYDSVNSALQEYSKLESSLGDSADIVLVGSRSAESIKSAYRNYFSDAQEFVSLVEQAIERLE